MCVFRDCLFVDCVSGDPPTHRERERERRKEKAENEIKVIDRLPVASSFVDATPPRPTSVSHPLPHPTLGNGLKGWVVNQFIRLVESLSFFDILFGIGTSSLEWQIPPLLHR